MVVSFLEVSHGLSDLFGVSEYPAVDGLLLECSEESLCHAVGLRLGDKGKAGGDSPTLDLVLKMIG